MTDGRRRHDDGARRRPRRPRRTATTARHGAGIDRTEEWAQLRARHLRAAGERPASAARGVHHVALLSSDVERTIGFYQDLLELPLTEVFENRDYQGSTHFFFDIGNGNALAFFDFPGLDLGPYAERLGGLHHLAISVEPERWQHLRRQAPTTRVCRPRGGWDVALPPGTRRRAHRAHRRPPGRDVRLAGRLGGGRRGFRRQGCRRRGRAAAGRGCRGACWRGSCAAWRRCRPAPAVRSGCPRRRRWSWPAADR